MDAFNQIMYMGCWVVLFLYTISTLVAFARQSCIACAASFFFACLLWLDLSLFNAWFFLPAFISHAREIDLQADDTMALVRVVLASEAARDVYLIMLGSFGSGLAVFNAASMLQSKDCMDMKSQDRRGFSKFFIESVYRACDYLDVQKEDAAILPLVNPEYLYYERKGSAPLENTDSIRRLYYL